MYIIVYIMFISFSFELKYNANDVYEEEMNKSIDLFVLTN